MTAADLRPLLYMGSMSCLKQRLFHCDLLVHLIVLNLIDATLVPELHNLTLGILFLVLHHPVPQILSAWLLGH